jgi:hypothetical protein
VMESPIAALKDLRFIMLPFPPITTFA